MIKLNGNELKIEKFPNYETKIKDFEELVQSTNLIELRYWDDNDLFYLWLVKKRLDELSGHVDLIIQYMPYSRMDRKISGDLFALKYVAEMINYLNFNSVTIVEPHSNITLNLIKNSRAIYSVLGWLNEIKANYQIDKVVLPDKGAAKRYDIKNALVFDKVRDPKTGKILEMKLSKGKVKPGDKLLIIDDLCSKGGTFAWSSQILKDMGAAEVYLAVAHCEETIFKGVLLDSDSPIEKIFCSKSMMDRRHQKIVYKEVKIKEVSHV